MSDTILLIEDSPDDVFFLQNAFKVAGILNPMQVARDGREAKDYLGGQGAYGDRERYPLPGLTILDLKLPRVMGLEVLRWIRGQPDLKSLIVIILTSSQLAPDIEQAYHLGVNAYLVKPSSTSELLEIAQGIKKFWLELNHPPTSQSLPPGANANHGSYLQNK